MTIEDDDKDEKDYLYYRNEIDKKRWREAKEHDIEPVKIDLNQMGDRRLILTRLFNIIDYLTYKIEKGKLRSDKLPVERVRLDYCKTLATLSNSYNQISRDVEMEDLKVKLEEIERRIGIDKVKDKTVKVVEFDKGGYNDKGRKGTD